MQNYAKIIIIYLRYASSLYNNYNILEVEQHILDKIHK